LFVNDYKQFNMNPCNRFHNIIAVLMMLLVLAGCGRSRATPPGKPYAVNFGQGIMALHVVTSSKNAPSTKHARSGYGGGSWNFPSNVGGSGKDALIGVVVVIGVVIVVATVVCVVDAISGDDDSPAMVYRYNLTISGPDVPEAVVLITDTHHMFLEQHQYDAMVNGAYTRAILRPTVWQGTDGAPTQAVRLLIAHNQITIEPLQSAAPPGSNNP
jgi:hypothetical protein